KGRRFTTAAHACDEVGPAWFRFVSPRLDPSLPEVPLDELHRQVLLTRRVGGVETDQVPRKLDDERERPHQLIEVSARRRSMAAFSTGWRSKFGSSSRILSTSSRISLISVGFCRFC